MGKKESVVMTQSWASHRGAFRIINGTVQTSYISGYCGNYTNRAVGVCRWSGVGAALATGIALYVSGGLAAGLIVAAYGINYLTNGDLPALAYIDTEYIKDTSHSQVLMIADSAYYT